jgi:hypothetical protein
MTDVDIVELPYHRLYRAQPTYRWWRPLVAILMTAVFFLGVSILVAIPVFVIVFTTGAIDLLSPTATQDLTQLITPDMARPWTLVFGLGSIILVLPFIPLALKIAGIQPNGVRVSILHSSGCAGAGWRCPSSRPPSSGSRPSRRRSASESRRASSCCRSAPTCRPICCRC